MTSTTNPTTSSSLSFQQYNQYRSFIFVLHEKYGILLLHCTRKVKKGNHYQIPGGHIDHEDFIAVTTRNTDISTTDTTVAESLMEKNSSIDESKQQQQQQLILQMAGMVGATRELYEETGIDLRNTIILPQHHQRIHPLQLYDSTETFTNKVLDNVNNIKNNVDDEKGLPMNQKHSKQLLINEYKKRLFYTVIVTDDDFIMVDHDNTNNSNTSRHLPLPPSHIRIQLSHEHSGYTFIKSNDIQHEITSMIQLHSGGTISIAFQMACMVKIKKGIDHINDPFWMKILANLNATSSSSFKTTVPLKIDGIGMNREQQDNDDDDDDDDDE